MIKPITFPMRPMNGGSLDKKPVLLNGHRVFEPKANGWRLTMYVETSSTWNRHNEPLSIGEEFSPAMELLKQTPFTWLDCEGLSRRHGIGKGTLIVLDLIDLHEHDYDVRRGMMEHHFEIIPSDITQVQPNSVYILPAYHVSPHGPLPMAQWEALKEQNERVGLKNENVFWEGFIEKRLTSKYEIQLRSDKQETTSWNKHRWL